MREENLPPSRKSTAALVVCQSAEAAFHCLMSAGVVYALQTLIDGSRDAGLDGDFHDRFPFWLVGLTKNSM
jgi:hypothetical protein